MDELPAHEGIAYECLIWKLVSRRQKNLGRKYSGISANSNTKDRQASIFYAKSQPRGPKKKSASDKHGNALELFFRGKPLTIKRDERGLADLENSCDRKKSFVLLSFELNCSPHSPVSVLNYSVSAFKNNLPFDPSNSFSLNMEYTRSVSVIRTYLSSQKFKSLTRP